jgi:D-beta-D-heptose 7-phosphate kinase/D-beta-D-heptose 1-phosphate adenosyltransferase
VKKLEDIRILVVGDIMLDKYVVGDVSRISPEAPVPIVKAMTHYSTLGGAGNVVRNLAEFGVQVHCAASITNDPEGKEVVELLHACGAISLLTWRSVVTTVKERIIADQRKVQMLRIDREVITDISPVELIEEIDIMLSQNGKYDIIVVSDYGKGLITWDLMDYLSILNTPIIIDPKPENSSLYGMPTMITPNRKEWAEMELMDACKPEFVLVTEGRDGMTLYDYRQGMGKVKIEGEPVEIYNVSGAGDTVVAVMATCLAMDIYPDEAANIANKCAAYVVTQVGTSTVPKNIFMNSLDMYPQLMTEENKNK